MTMRSHDLFHFLQHSSVLDWRMDVFPFFYIVNPDHDGMWNSEGCSSNRNGIPPKQNIATLGPAQNYIASNAWAKTTGVCGVDRCWLKLARNSRNVVRWIHTHHAAKSKSKQTPRCPSVMGREMFYQFVQPRNWYPTSATYHQAEPAVLPCARQDKTRRSFSYLRVFLDMSHINTSWRPLVSGETSQERTAPAIPSGDLACEELQTHTASQQRKWCWEV